MTYSLSYNLIQKSEATKQYRDLKDKCYNILMIGDVVGRPGRTILKKTLPFLKNFFNIHFTTLNGENLAGGFGITEKIFHEILDLGIQAITLGNHWNDKVDIHNIKHRREIILPQNIYSKSYLDIPEIYDEKHKKSIHIINLLGKFAMSGDYSNPFDFLKKSYDTLKTLSLSSDAILIADIHAEASSEKQAIACYLDGILNAMIGTHTHVPTSDERLSDRQTAYLTDIGMTGAYDSIIGMDSQNILKKFFDQEKKPFCVAKNDPWLNAFLVQVDNSSGLSLACHRIQYREKTDFLSISSLSKSELTS